MIQGEEYSLREAGNKGEIGDFVSCTSGWGLGEGCSGAVGVNSAFSRNVCS